MCHFFSGFMFDSYQKNLRLFSKAINSAGDQITISLPMHLYKYVHIAVRLTRGPLLTYCLCVRRGSVTLTHDVQACVCA